MPGLKRLSLNMGMQIQAFRGVIVKALDADEGLGNPPGRGKVDEVKKRRFKIWVGGDQTSWEMDERVKGEKRRSVEEERIVTVGPWPADW